MPGKIASLHNRVMIVDDNEDMLHLYDRLLTQEGFQIFTATTGADCLKQIESVSPDIFMLDVVLPDCNGIDLVREIKACPEFTGSMIILMSSMLTDSYSRTAGLEAGALDYLVRPVPFKELLAKLKSFIKVMDFQQSLVAFNDRLDQMVIERTREISNTVMALNQANDKLKKNELTMRKLSQAVEQSPVSIEITDLDGRIEYVNPKFVELTGYSVEELIGRKPNVLKTGNTPAETYQKLWSTITAGSIWEGEFCNKRKDGSIYYERARIGPINDKNGEITHYLAVKEDITEKKSLAEQLLQSQKLESVGQLAGGLAHELNNILTVITGNTTLLKLGYKDDAEILQHVSEIQQSVSRASDLTNRLLAFSRKQEIIRSSFCLNSLIENFGRFVSRIIRGNIRFTISLMNDPPIISVDTGQIEQALLNLVLNSQDSIPEYGEIIIASSTVKIGDEKSPLLKEEFLAGEYALITVSDSGHGMDEATRAKIFDPFFTTKEVGKGTGLGLSVVMGIIKSHGGFIDLQSAPGGGSVFCMYLPIDYTLNC